jgi:hypothetical protein
MRLGLFDPARSVRFTDEPKKPPEEAQSVAPLQTEARCKRAQPIGEGAGGLMTSADRVRDELRHRFGVLMVREEVGGDAGWSRNKESALVDPLPDIEPEDVEADVLASRLSPFRDDEIVPIGWKVTEVIKSRGRAMGDDALLRHSLPDRGFRRELQPCRPEREVIRRRRSGELIDTMRDPLERAVMGQPLQRRSCDASLLDLTASEQTPLLCRNVSDASECLSGWHYCILAQG